MDKDSLEYQLLLANRIPIDCSSKPLIYFLFDGDELVYIGQSRRGLSRIPAHAGSKVFTHFTWIPCPVNLLDNTEAYYILQFKPKYNSSLPGNEVYKTRKEAAKVYGWTIPEAREYVENFDDIPVREMGGNEYISTRRVGYCDAKEDEWFPSIELLSNEELASEPYLQGRVVDIRRQFQVELG